MRFPISCGIICLIFLCSCATQKEAPPSLPTEVSLNPGAGRGDFIRVKLRLETGQELSFTVDTASPRTILDKSLEPKLGKRLVTRDMNILYGLMECGLYKTPKLYLGNAQLLMTDHILAGDLHKFFGPSYKADGILGMDCLRHYCIQLDFAAGKMRFLDPDHAGDEDLGEAFPLTIPFGDTFADTVARGDYFGTGRIYFEVDTGNVGDVDALFDSESFHRELKIQKAAFLESLTTSDGNPEGVAGFSTNVFGNQTYSDLTFLEWKGPHDWADQNNIGLSFLARNLVTFDFPKGVMYLKQQSVGPLDPSDFLTIEAAEFSAKAADFCRA